MSFRTAHGLCKLCREEAATLAAAVPAPAVVAVMEQPACTGRVGDDACGRVPLPTRSVFARHRAQELAEVVA